MRILILIIAFLAMHGDLFASWYGCPEYNGDELERMSEQELRSAHAKNIELSEQIYEDAAVQSIMDKRLYHFRSQQYLDCINYRKEIDRVIQSRFPETKPAEQ